MSDRFRTPVAPLLHQGMLSHTTPMLMLGSCFAANIGRRLERELFDVTVNPLGTLYNPASIATVVERLAGEAEFAKDEDIAEREGITHCWLCHSSMSDTAPRHEYLERLNAKARELRGKLAEIDTTVLTFGTRNVFALAESGYIVANCHKFPAATFNQRQLSLEECHSYMARTAAALRSINPTMKIILTVSPVRYVGEGLHNSTLSKAILLLACDWLSRETDNTIYFPSYEIMMDDLRDYRFYAADMKHPDEVAVDYIYGVFAESFFDNRTRSVATRAAKLTSRMAHRPICASPQSLQSFHESTAAFARTLSSEFPELAPRIRALAHDNIPPTTFNE
ncbi:MAG: GSCFA domain-containing protein [Muribaculaceae bacterium]|nr:GSCFA domain-containing protein [Muribaculaceae bacterium]